MKCQYCEGSVDLPFKCPFCGGYFCADHRLPENHACTELRRAVMRVVESRRRFPEGSSSMWETPRGYMPYFRTKPRWFSFTEVLHLTAATLMVMAVGLSLLFQSGFSPRLMELWVGASFVFTSLCILHELAHKAAARHYGLWAEFRLNLLGAMLTILSIILPVKFVSPGAVMISGEADKKIVGMTALAGPFTNMILSALLYASSFLVPYGPLLQVMIFGSMLSSWISLFNLVPISMMDGAKILWWDKKAWLISFLASLTLVALTFITTGSL